MLTTARGWIREASHRALRHPRSPGSESASIGRRTFAAGLAGLLLLFLLVAQFVAYFNFSNIPGVPAVRLGDIFEQLPVGALRVLIGVIVISMVAPSSSRRPIAK
jgi:hypothetical protein